MLAQRSVRVTYAHKRRRVQNASKNLLSSPLEVLPPDVGDLTHAQMARRMLKRSRRVALADQLVDRNTEPIRERLAKRIKHAQERGPDIPSQNGIVFQTPFHSQLERESSAKPLAPEQLSPVPIARRVMSRTSSRNLKENAESSRTLQSPFCSRPSSAASSPKFHGRGSSGRSSRRFLHAKSRTLSGVFKENARQVSRKGSTTSLKDMNMDNSARRTRHRRYPSSPSASYMRPQFAENDWLAPFKAFSRTSDDHGRVPSLDASPRSDSSFYINKPLSCSTPAKSRPRYMSGPSWRQTKTDSFSDSSFQQDSVDADVEMIDGTIPLRRRTIHLSGNSIFSSSDEFTIATLSPVKNNVMRGRSRTGLSMTGSSFVDYDIPISDLACSPEPTVANKILCPDGVPKASVGDTMIDLPGTSPAYGGNLIRAVRNSVVSPPMHPGTLNPEIVPELLVRKKSIVLSSASPEHGGNLIFRAAGNCDISSLSTSLRRTTIRPSSPASDLVQELGSMEIHGDSDTHSDGEEQRSFVANPLQARSRSLQEPPTLSEPTLKKTTIRRRTRKRSSTIRASDFAKPGAASSAVGRPLSNVRRTRSGTVVGPDSTLATKGAGLHHRPSKAALGLTAIRSDPESDDELLLKVAWAEDMKYLGRSVQRDKTEVEADELNLGGTWDRMAPTPPRRPKLRRR